MRLEFFGGLFPTTRTHLLIKNCYSSARGSHTVAGCVEAGKSLSTPVLNNVGHSFLPSE